MYDTKFVSRMQQMSVMIIMGDEMMNLKEFGIYFAELREKSGYRSQRELADKSGVSHSTINRIEAGTHKAKPETLKAVAPFLKGVDYEELLEKAGILNEDQSNVSTKKDDLAELHKAISRAFHDFDSLPEDEKNFLLEEIPETVQWKLNEFRKAKAKFLEQKNNKNKKP